MNVVAERTLKSIYTKTVLQNSKWGAKDSNILVHVFSCDPVYSKSI